MSHDGYLRSDGVTHRRRLFLSANGEDFRGEDTVSGAEGVPFAIRFHLHPSVNASLLQSGRSALLKPPKGGAWRLSASAQLAVTDSIYFEAAPEPRRTVQIVIAGVSGAESGAVKWALRREGRRD
jgi:uncharacterized heparinase superfamily protein